MCTAAACLIVAALTLPGSAQTEGLAMKPVFEMSNPSSKDAMVLTPDEIRGRGPESKVILYRNELPTNDGVFIYEVVEGAASCSLDACPGALGFRKKGSSSTQRIAEGTWDYGDTSPRISKDLTTLTVGSAHIKIGSHQ